jgi:riboflavin synthase
VFTGIIEVVGEVLARRMEGEVLKLRIRCGAASEGVSLGDSIAVNGACLTVTRIDGEQLDFDAIRETLDKTALGDLEPGSKVNLERAMQAGGRLDGHIVQGHVDGVGTVRSLERRGDDVQLYVDCSPELAGMLVDKGSVTIDGVSLTVVRAEAAGFDVALIPHTLAHTNLADAKPGHRVNLEVDILGKYVKSYLDRMLPQAADAGLASPARDAG